MCQLDECHDCPQVSLEEKIKVNSYNVNKLRWGSITPNAANPWATVAQNHLQATGALIHHCTTEELLSPAQRAEIPPS